MILHALALIAQASVPLAPTTVTVTDGQWASEGEYMVIPQPWCRDLAPLVAGRDYANSINWQKGAMPVVQITWRFPAAAARPNVCGVWGYSFVAWNGGVPGGGVYKPVAARRISEIADLTIAYGMDIAADPSSYNMLAEGYLTEKPGDYSKAVEFAFFPWAPDSTRGFLNSGRQLGTFTDRYGRAWSAAVGKSGNASSFVTFAPVKGGYTWGTLDMQGALKFAVAAGAVNGGWYFNGVAIGIEPIGGFGTAILRTFKPVLR